MATLALSIAGQAVGGLVGGPLGATVGRALGALAGNALDTALLGTPPEQTAPSPLALQGSTRGAPIARIYGWSRLSGNIIWATELAIQDAASGGAKGDQTGGDGDIVANFAVGLCEGEVSHLGRIWADGRLLETENLSIRFYRGTSDQAPDPLLESVQGAGNTPAYRGLCYLVFEGLVLTPFGNRIPNISVELCRSVGDLEPAIRAITVIPGATEFGYDPQPRVRIVSSGVTTSENTSLLGQTSDWTLSIDQLMNLCPNLKHVALVVSWFADDLRCGTCRIQPRSLGTTRTIQGTSWRVSDSGRADVPVVSEHNGGPAYGGTPSDSAVLAAIADLKLRGVKVTLYPFILMDVPATNSLPDPYTGNSGQPAYPWRGRITCDPAPGQTGSPDTSLAVDTQVTAFVGSAQAADFTPGNETVSFSGGADWGYRRMLLHYAQLAVMAGGVDAFVMGSEMRGMTFLRNSATTFPFVDALCTLATDLRAVLGAGTRLVYGADWSEYSGYQPPDQPGDKLFHLDKLWARPELDAIGIDNYMPLSDWRGSSNEPDAALAAYPHQLAYLGANIAGGEGFDWYYVSQDDRTNATRTPITDGVGGEPWIWRYKDLISWWSNPHHNRVNGARDASPTAWIPQSKPFWFTELGCPAVDKGTNQPNLFQDPKSAQSARPWFSDGNPDPLIQRQFLRAHHRHWQPGSVFFDSADNPVSTVYGAPMVDPDRLYVWTWDARPYPAFPNRSDIWSDGPNHVTGHWVTGRLGTASVGEYLTAMAAEYDVSLSGSADGRLQIDGVQLGALASMRRATDTLLGASRIRLRDSPDGVELVDAPVSAPRVVLDEQIAADNGPLVSSRASNVDEAAGKLVLSHADRTMDYQSATSVALYRFNPEQVAVGTNMVLHGAAARIAAENLLLEHLQTDSIHLKLPASFRSLQVGDELVLPDRSPEIFTVTELSEGVLTRVGAQRKRRPLILSANGDMQTPPYQPRQSRVLPALYAAHLPGKGGDLAGTRLALAAFSDPWPGTVSFVNNATGTTLAHTTASTMSGILTAALPPGVAHLWDRVGTLSVHLDRGHPGSLGETDVLNGANRLLVQKDDGSWEMIGFANAILVGPQEYALSGLLRGQSGTVQAATRAAASGNACLLLPDGIAWQDVENDVLEQGLTLTALAGSQDTLGQDMNVALDPQLAFPRPPVHLKAREIVGSQDIAITWVRATSVGGDSWVGSDVPLDFAPESYLVRIFDGATQVREFTTGNPDVTYWAADQISDLGGALLPFSYEVRQVSAVHGPGIAASADYPG